MKKFLIVIAAFLLLGGFLAPKPASAFIGSSAIYAGVGGFAAKVDWSVYSPAEAGGQSALDYTYYYIITNNSTASASNWITFFSVGNPGSAVITGFGAAPIGGIAPTFIIPGTSGSAAIFYTPPIPSGFWSEKIFLTSPVPPAPVDGGLLAIGGATDTQILRGPSIIPEPSSMLLFGMGILGLLGLGRKKA